VAAWRRRQWLAAAGALASGMLAFGTLAGCGTPLPPPRLLRLPDGPPTDGPTPPPPSSAAPPVWQLMLLGGLPELLSRDEVLVADGDVGLRPLPGVRWAEPWRDALPRLLLQDLGAWRGPGSVWAAPLPPGLPVAAVLRPQLLALDADPARQQVVLSARWSLADPRGQQRPVAGSVTVSQRWAGGSDALVRAQRALLWRWAAAMADTRLAPASAGA
jgi:uncharacterized lipoprotein YmbA